MGDGMKKYKASDLSHKRAEVMKEARNGGVIIQECRTNGEVVGELAIVDKEELSSAIWVMYDLLQDEVYNLTKLEEYKKINDFMSKVEKL